MNLICAAGCRVFQTVFKLAIPLLPYREPKILNHVKEVPAVLKEQGISCVLIVTDAFLHGSGLLDPLKQALRDAGIAFHVHDETMSNPTIRNVESARAIYQKYGCQGLIGFGGGSAIDCAKAVGARIACPRKTIPQMRGILKIGRKIPFLLAVPTTAGTGSETTVTTVITDGDAERKYPISDFPLIPRAALLDPEITRTLPRHVTATTGMDALTHAIEAYIGRSTTKETRGYALRAAELIEENLENAYRDADGITARAHMLNAAYLAGSAFSRSYVGYCHAVAHTLGGKYHTPHGLANAVLLPYVLEAYGSSIYRKGKDIAVAMHLVDKTSDSKEATEKLIAHIREMNRRMGIPEKLPGIRKEDIPQLAAYAAKEANPIYPVPVLMDRKELERFYYDVLEESV